MIISYNNNILSIEGYSPPYNNELVYITKEYIIFDFYNQSTWNNCRPPCYGPEKINIINDKIICYYSLEDYKVQIIESELKDFIKSYYIYKYMIN